MYLFERHRDIWILLANVMRAAGHTGLLSLQVVEAYERGEGKADKEANQTAPYDRAQRYTGRLYPRRQRIHICKSNGRFITSLFERLRRAALTTSSHANSPFSSMSLTHQRVCLPAPRHSSSPGSAKKHLRLRCCTPDSSQRLQLLHESQPRSHSQLGISQDSRTRLGPSQSPGPRHWRLRVRSPKPQLAEHSDQSLQHDHWPSASDLKPD